MAYGKEKIGFLGLSFKGGTDDLRNSPIIDLIEILLGKGYDIKIYDKNVHISKLVGANKEYILQRIPFVSKFLIDDLTSMQTASDLLVVVNNEPEFVEFVEQLPPEKIVYDLVHLNLSDASKLPNYSGIAW